MSNKIIQYYKEGGIIYTFKKLVINSLKFLLPTSFFYHFRKTYFDFIYWFKLGRKFKTPQVVEIEGKKSKFKIKIDPKNGAVDGVIFRDRTWERHITKVIEDFKKDDLVFVDIGTNIGFFSLLVASLSPKNKVFSFEPLPHLVKQFNESIELNNFKNIEIFNFALGDKNEKTILYSNDASNIGASTVLPTKKNINSIETPIEIKIADEVLSEKGKVDLIKIDVEGFEMEVLKGLEKTIKKFHPQILLEYSPAFYTGERGSSKEGIINFLFSRQYQICDLRTGKIYKTAKEWFEEEGEKIRQTDIFAFVL